MNQFLRLAWLILAAPALSVASGARADVLEIGTNGAHWIAGGPSHAKPQGLIAIPSAKPVNLGISLSSGFGVRSDPFRGGAAMHSGVDIPGPVGTPIYATADGVVVRTGWVGGYGNLVELEHGEGIQTRYGHLSQIVATPGSRVKRGQLIGMMGSTGRSTGSHLHYEVRLGGRAVNPTHFLRTHGYLLAMERRNAGNLALGGPDKAE